MPQGEVELGTAMLRLIVAWIDPETDVLDPSPPPTNWILHTDKTSTASCLHPVCIVRHLNGVWHGSYCRDAVDFSALTRVGGTPSCVTQFWAWLISTQTEGHAWHMSTKWKYFLLFSHSTPIWLLCLRTKCASCFNLDNMFSHLSRV